MNSDKLGILATRIFNQNKAIGWWDDLDRCILTSLQLVSTEISEATQGERRDVNDAHLKHRKMGEVELVDALARLLDLAGRFGIPLKQVSVDVDVYHSIGAHHAVMTMLLGRVIEGYYYGFEIDIEKFNYLLSYILRVAERMGYDMETVMEEKLAYNLQREDHKRESRAKENGKKF